MRTGIVIAYAACMLAACTDEQERTEDRMEYRWQQMQKEVEDPDLPGQEEFEAEKEQVTSELLELRSDLEERIEEIEKELSDPELDPQKRSEHEHVRNEFQRQLLSIRQFLDEVVKASRKEWIDLEQEVETFYENEGIDSDREVEINEDLDLNRNAEEVR